MNTSLISRFFVAVVACLGLAQAALAQDSIAAETAASGSFPIATFPQNRNSPIQNHSTLVSGQHNRK